MPRHRTTAEIQPTPPTIDDAIAPLVARLVDERLARLGVAPGMVDPIVPVGDALPVSRSRANALCRSGSIEGAKLIGRTWCARRSAIDSYLAALPAPAPPSSRGQPDPLGDTLAGLGFGGGANDARRARGSR